MSAKKVTAVIPARMGAARFPGKPLVKILGLPMVEHVRRRALLAQGVDEVVVATCDREILETVEGFGGKAVMTRDTHERCTDRVEEAAGKLDFDIALIVQGDEPLFRPEALTILARPLMEDPGLPCANLLSVIRDERDLEDEDIVKAVLDEQGFVLFFSRAPIPFRRVRNDCPLYRQTGLSAFSREFLSEYSRLAPTAIEVAESVDFLRILGHRRPIKGVAYDKVAVGVDRPDDVAKVEEILRRDPEQKEIFERILAF